MTRENVSAVAIVDDDPAIGKSVARLLKLHDFSTRTFTSALALLQGLDDFIPNCIVADLAMPGISGLELQERLTASGAHYPIVFITGHGDIRSSVHAMQGGAVDFITKPFEQSELLDAIRRATSKDRSRRTMEFEFSAMRGRLDTLTRRERQVFEQVVEGLMNKQIASRLHIAEKTVKVHRARVMRKMAVSSVAELARMAERLRLHPSS